MPFRSSVKETNKEAMEQEDASVAGAVAWLRLILIPENIYRGRRVTVLATFTHTSATSHPPRGWAANSAGPYSSSSWRSMSAGNGDAASCSSSSSWPSRHQPKLAWNSASGWYAPPRCRSAGSTTLSSSVASSGAPAPTRRARKARRGRESLWYIAREESESLNARGCGVARSVAATVTASADAASRRNGSGWERETWSVRGVGVGAGAGAGAGVDAGDGEADAPGVGVGDGDGSRKEWTSMPGTRCRAASRTRASSRRSAVDTTTGFCQSRCCHPEELPAGAHGLRSTTHGQCRRGRNSHRRRTDARGRVLDGLAGRRGGSHRQTSPASAGGPLLFPLPCLKRPW